MILSTTLLLVLIATVTDDILDVSGLLDNGGAGGAASVVIGDLADGIDLTGGPAEIGVIWNASAATINDNMGTAFTVDRYTLLVVSRLLMTVKQLLPTPAMLKATTLAL